MSNVASLFGGPTGQPEVVEDTVKVLEAALAKAKSGEIVGVTIIAVHHDHFASFANAGPIGAYSALGALDMAKHDLMNIIAEQQ